MENATYFIDQNNDLYGIGHNNGHFNTGDTKDTKIPIKITDNVKQVSYRDNNMVILKNNGDLYISGYNRWQLGGGEKNSKIIFLIDKNVSQCSISYFGDVVYCKNDGSVYFGGFKNVIGYPYSDICEETIRLDIDKKIKSCFCTDEDGFYLIDDEYGIYAFGYNISNFSTIPKKNSIIR